MRHSARGAHEHANHAEPLTGVWREQLKHALVRSFRLAGERGCHERWDVQITDRYGVGIAVCDAGNQPRGPWPDTMNTKQPAIYIRGIRIRVQEMMTHIGTREEMQCARAFRIEPDRLQSRERHRCQL